MERFIDQFAERFWSKVERKGADECWLWKPKPHPSGYGQFKVAAYVFKAHRVAYALTHPEFEVSTGLRGAQGVLVLHSCDNRRCCNPAHLSAGSQLENIQDAARKYRMGQGTDHPLAKLTPEDVATIKQLHADGLIWRSGQKPNGATNLNELARRFGVTRQSIVQVIEGRSWKSVGNISGSTEHKLARQESSRLTEAQETEIRKMARHGLLNLRLGRGWNKGKVTLASVAILCGVTTAEVVRVLNTQT